MIGRTLIAFLICIGLAHAGLETEIQQQQEIEERLRTDLEMQKKISTQRYFDAIELAEGAIINRDEQLERLKAANSIWDEFIEKICAVSALESIGTRAERASSLQCMIEKYKEKELFFSSLI